MMIMRVPYAECNALLDGLPSANEKRKQLNTSLMGPDSDAVGGRAEKRSELFNSTRRGEKILQEFKNATIRNAPIKCRGDSCKGPAEPPERMMVQF